MQITQSGAQKKSSHLLLQHCSFHITAVVLGAFCLTIWGLMFPLVLFAQAQDDGLSLPPPPPIESVLPAASPAIQPVAPLGGIVEPMKSAPTGEELKPPSQFLKPPSQLIEEPKNDPVRDALQNSPREDFKSEASQMRIQRPSAEMGDSKKMIDSSQSGSEEEKGDQEEARVLKQQQEREARQLKQFQRGVKGVEQGLKMFKKQVDRITKQGLTLPAEIASNLDKVSAAITTVKEADSLEIAQAGMEDIMDGMQTLQESREDLEKLTRWPQVNKQIDQMIKNLNRQLKQDQNLAAKLAKQGFDISDLVGKFDSGIKELQGVQASAKEKLATDIDGAFETLQDGFYEKMDDVQQSHQTIQMLSNLGRFTSTYKREVVSYERGIKELKRRKLDTTDLETAFATIKEKGAVMQSLLQIKPIDPEAVQSALEDLGAAKQEFENAKTEALGDDGQTMPWEQGQNQFNVKGFDASSISKFLPSKEPAQ